MSRAILPPGARDPAGFTQNNFDDHVLDQNGKPLPFTINGMMSAGNQVRIGRDFGDNPAPWKRWAQLEKRRSGPSPSGRPP